MGFKMSTKETLAKFDKAEKEFPDAIGVTVEEHVTDVFAETQVLVPKLTHALEATGKIKKNESGNNKFSFSIWYGGGEVDYAAAVHEILRASHEPPTQAKYVEQPLIESVGALKKRINSAANKAKKVAFK